MNKKPLFIVLLLTFSVFLVETPPMAKAEGSVDAQDIWMKCDDDAYPEGFSSSDDGAGSTFEDVIRGSIIVHSDLMGLESTWDFNVTRLNFYLDVNGATHLSTAAIYQFISSDNAGALYGETAEKSLSGTGWKYFYPDNPIEIPSGTSPKYWSVINADQLTGYIQLRYDSNTGSGETLAKIQTYGTYPNPMTGETSSTSYDYWIRGYVTAFTTNQTVFNQYYDVGNITEARRDIDVTFPSGVSNREIKMSLPRNEKLLNITYNDGGEWNASLSGSDYTLDKYYNETHMLITLPEATIASYGEDLRVFSETYDYVFTLKGLFLENGTRDGAVTVTAHYLSDSEEREVDGEIEVGYDEKPIQFTWSLEGGGSRRIYTYEGSYDIYIFTPDDDYASYSFSIRDYTGTIGTGDTFLEALRLVNGTEMVIERVLIWDTVNKVPLTLTQSQIYVLQVRMPDDSIYRFGYFVPSGDATPILTLKEISFSQKAQLTGKYVTVEATRPTDTHIRINYNDTLLQTESVFVEVCYRNGTQAWNDTSSADSFQFNWLSANNETDYVVNVEIEHEFFGILKYSQALSGAKGSHSTAPDFSLFGDWGPIEGSNVFSIILILIVAGAFSRVSGPVGLFCSIMTAGGLTYAEWINIDYKIIAAALALNALYAYAEAK